MSHSCVSNRDVAVFPQKSTKLATNGKQSSKRFLQLIFKWLNFFHFSQLHKLYNLHLSFRH